MVQRIVLNENHPDFLAFGGLEGLDESGVRYEQRDDGVIELKLPLRKPEQEVLRLKKYIPPSKWAERHRYISKRFRHGGKWNNDTVPYLAGIMDASFYKSVEEIIICAVPQSGKTEGVYTCLAYAADRRPGDVMILFPTETDAKDNAKDRIKPMFQDSPRLRRYLTGYMDDLGQHKITLKNMLIYMAWANSPSRLSNRPAMYGYSDEEDKHPVTASKKEGAPNDLLKKRTTTFQGLRKIWRTSSPSVEAGPIWRALTEQAHIVFEYWVVCPTCGGSQLMEFKRLTWSKDADGKADAKGIEENRKVWYECCHCDAKWDDYARDLAVRGGQWRDRDTNLELFASLESRQPLRIGFHIPGWISPFIKLYEIAAAFLKGQKGQPDWRNKLKDFKNGFAAQPWKSTETNIDERRILALRDDRLPGQVPGNGDVLCLLAGVDTHGLDDRGRLDYEIRAFGYGHNPTTWSIRFGHLNSFEALEKVLWEDKYLDPDGIEYPVILTCIDAMGRRTADVYNFCKKHPGLIVPCQGKEQLSRVYRPSTQQTYPGLNKKIPGGLDLFLHHTNYLKNQLSTMLEVLPGDPGCWYYHSQLDLDWAEQMCAEEIDPETQRWINPRSRANHAWDVSVLQLLAAHINDIWGYKRPGQQKGNQGQAKPQVVARSKFITGGR
jgi:phage terminase large subunit GpA-like protein